MAGKRPFHMRKVVQATAGDWPGSWVLKLACGHEVRRQNRLTRAQCWQCPKQQLPK